MKKDTVYLLLTLIILVIIAVGIYAYKYVILKESFNYKQDNLNSTYYNEKNDTKNEIFVNTNENIIDEEDYENQTSNVIENSSVYYENDIDNEVTINGTNNI